MESKSNTVHLEQVVCPILSHQCMPSYHSTPQEQLEASVDCNTDEMLVTVLDEFDNDLLNDMITKDNEFLDSFTPRIGEDFLLFKNVDHNDSGKASRWDPLYPTAHRIQHEMKPKVKDTTAMYIDQKLRPQDGYIGIQVQANQMQVVKQAPPPLLRNDVIQSTVYLQDVREETTVAGAKYYRKLNHEANNGGSNNKLIFESVNTQYECENAIEHSEIHSGTRNVLNGENSLFKTRQTFQNYNCIDKDQKAYACDVCYKTFDFESNLRRHLLIHTGEKPYACETCKKSFSQKGDLKRHSYIHTDGRPYKCGVCDKSFRQKRELRGHSILHNDEKPHSCGFCEKSFRRKQDLLLHSRIHTGEKPFVCNVCQKGFRARNGLRYHSDEVCGKSVTQRSNLLSHSKLHTDKKLD